MDLSHGHAYHQETVGKVGTRDQDLWADQIETSWGVEDVATPALAGSRLAVALVSASTIL